MKTATLTVMDAQQLNARLASGENFEFWNVLTDAYFSGGMMPGSKRVPLDSHRPPHHGHQLDRNAEIVVYCSGSTCPQSRLADEKLAHLGFTNVTVFEGGLRAWEDARSRLDTI